MVYVIRNTLSFVYDKQFHIDSLFTPFEIDMKDRSWDT